MNLQDTKSLLAKLMATENLNIEHRNVQTASFDVKNRTLTIPTLDKNISGYLYDLFVGHEVGHALWTPLDGLLKAQKLKINLSVTNVVEDSRIERKIKYKYPGIRNSFVRGYNELVEKDFFRTKGLDLSKLNLIDRINLYCKGGPMLGIKFDTVEKELLNAVETTETYDDVLEVSCRIVEYMKQQKQIQKEKEKELQEELELSNEDFEEFMDGISEKLPDEFDNTGYEDSDEFTNDPVKESSEQSGNSQSEVDDLEEDDDVTESEGAESVQNEEDDDIRSHTDDSFKENESKLFDDSGKDNIYLDIPVVDLEKVIFYHKELWKKFKSDMNAHFSYDYSSTFNSDFNKFRTETNKVVSYLAKEFELRKNADQLKRTSTAKTGELNMKSIFSYQFNEDIFKKVSVVPDGKSHGLVMFIDWSGSMCDHLGNTIKQLLSLVLFCRKVNIPYEVYAFADVENCYEGVSYNSTPKDRTLSIENFRLFNFLSSSMSASEFRYASSALMMIAQGAARHIPSWMGLSGTPLNEAVISALEIVPFFQKKYKLQVVNTVFLTDGEGHNIRRYHSKNIETGELQTEYVSNYKYIQSTQGCNIVICDPKTKESYKISEYDIYNSTENTKAYVHLLKARTGCNVVGFYVISSRDFKHRANKWFGRHYNDLMEIKLEFRKNKSIVVTNGGFDEYYILRSESLDTEEDVDFVVKENATTRGLVSAFSKYTSGRTANRVILNRFIGLIS